MKTRFYLRPSGHDTQVFYVFADFRFNGDRLRKSTQIQVKNSKWDNEKEELKGRSPEIQKINTLLSNIKSTVGKWEEEKIKSNQPVLKLELENEFLKLVNPNKISKPIPTTYLEEKITDLYSYLQFYIKRGRKKDGAPLSKSTMRAFKWFKNQIMIQFVEKYGAEACMFENIDQVFEKKLSEFIYNNDYDLSTHGKCIKMIKTLMGSSHEDKLHNNMLYIHFTRHRKVSDAFALTENEIQHMYKLEISPRLEPTRDLFIFSYCIGGMRVGDGIKIHPDGWQGDFFTYKPTKTSYKGDWITVPLRKESRALLKKYKGLFPKITEQTMNKNLKKIGVLIPTLHQPFLYSTTKGGVNQNHSVPKYVKLTTHTARRSFCTNEFDAGVEPLDIMYMSGHKSLKQFLDYVKTTSTRKAEKYRQIYKERGLL